MGSQTSHPAPSHARLPTLAHPDTAQPGFDLRIIIFTYHFIFQKKNQPRNVALSAESQPPLWPPTSSSCYSESQKRDAGREMAAAPPRAGAPAPKAWVKGTAATHPFGQCGNQICGKFSEVGAAAT
jgi:hypothetical protein